MTTVTNRYDVKAAIVDALQAHTSLLDVPVSYGWPGKHLEREHVWLANTTGTVNYPHVMAGRKTREDDYTITILFMASKDGKNLAEAEERVQEMYQALDDLAADGELIGTHDGVEWSLHGETVDGPNSELTDKGAVAFIRADVSIRARYL